MNYFLLPQLYKENCLEYIDVIHDENVIENYNHSLNEYLNKIKEQIDLLDNIEDWDIYKKYTNPYEYIHTLIPNIKKTISTIRPISRAYYKLVEIINALNINDFNKPINTFHLAEGPGGFVEAVCNIRSNAKDKYYAMTLLNNNPDVPGWNKSIQILNSFPNIYIEWGKDNTGDLFSLENIIYCKNKYNNTMDLITGDGGFDFSTDFNKQETLGFNLIFAQVCYAIAMQKINGHFILKIYDSFTKPTIDILYLLNTLYKKVYIMKPETSRYANSEKYIVCKHFKNINSSDIFNKLIKNYFLIKTKPITNVLNNHKNSYFINKIIEYNSIFGQQQIENISLTLALINHKNDTDKIETLKKNNIFKCIKWCKKNKIPYNNISLNT